MTEALQRYESRGFLAPVMTIEQALQGYQLKKDLISRIFKKEVDYGTIPGSKKDSLFKAGAEKAINFFGLTNRFVGVETIEDWTGKDHSGEPFFYYRQSCELSRDGAFLGAAEGSCSSWESKYRYRMGERLCPECGKPAIKRSKYAPKDRKLGSEPGWYCYDKAGGCGTEFAASDPEIVAQQLGRVQNPDVADLVNTVLKMAQKRSLVAAVLVVTGMSDYFTQDAEDYIDVQAEPVKAAADPVPDAPKPSPIESAKAKLRARKAAEPPPVTPPAPAPTTPPVVDAPPLLYWSKAVSYGRSLGLAEDEAIDLLSEHGCVPTVAPSDEKRGAVAFAMAQLADARKTGKPTLGIDKEEAVEPIQDGSGFPARGEDLLALVGESAFWLSNLKPLVLGTLKMGNKRAVSMWKHMDEDQEFSEQPTPSLASMQAVCDAVNEAIKEG